MYDRVHRASLCEDVLRGISAVDDGGFFRFRWHFPVATGVREDQPIQTAGFRERRSLMPPCKENCGVRSLISNIGYQTIQNQRPDPFTIGYQTIQNQRPDPFTRTHWDCWLYLLTNRQASGSFDKLALFLSSDNSIWLLR